MSEAVIKNSEMQENPSKQRLYDNSLNQTKELNHQSHNNLSTNEKWEKIAVQDQTPPQQQTPFLLQQESFKSGNKFEEFNHQKSIMQQAANQGRQLLKSKNYDSAAKQLSKTLMAFEFIAKNHVATVGKQQIKQMLLQTVLPAYNNLALCYLKLKNYQLVVSFTCQVLGQDPDNVKARYRKALALKQLKNTQEAIQDFQIVRKLDPEMEGDCTQKIKQCKAIELQERKKRKLSAQKFISGYQSEDIKVSSQQPSKSPNHEAPNNFQVYKQNMLLKWLKEKCKGCSRLFSGCSQLFSKIRPKSSEEEKKN